MHRQRSSRIIFNFAKSKSIPDYSEKNQGLRPGPYRRPGTVIGTGTVSLKTSSISADSIASLPLLLFETLPDESDESDESSLSMTGTRTPHSQFRQLSLGCLVILSWTRRPLASGIRCFLLSAFCLGGRVCICTHHALSERFALPTYAHPRHCVFEVFGNRIGSSGLMNRICSKTCVSGAITSSGERIVPCYASEGPAADSYSRAAHDAGIWDCRTILTGNRSCRRSLARLVIARWLSGRGSRL